MSGTDRDCLHALDVIFGNGEGRRADVIVTDTESHSDLVFDLTHLLGKEYRPALADLPDQKVWRTKMEAYGALNRLTRGSWVWTRSASGGRTSSAWSAPSTPGPCPPTTWCGWMLQRDGHPTALGEAINTYGRTFTSLHVLHIIDDEDMRRDIKGTCNLQEGRHALAEEVFHGRKGQVFQRYTKECRTSSARSASF